MNCSQYYLLLVVILSKSALHPISKYLFIGVLSRMCLFGFSLAFVGPRNCFLYVVSLDLRVPYCFLHSNISLSKARRCPGQVWIVFA